MGTSTSGWLGSLDDIKILPVIVYEDSGVNTTENSEVPLSRFLEHCAADILQIKDSNWHLLLYFRLYFILFGM